MNYSMIYTGSGARVEFVLQRGTPAKNKAMFDYLHERSAQIETAFGGPLEWRRCDDKKLSMVATSKKFPGFEREAWPAMIEWLVVTVPKFQKTFGPEIDALRQLLSSRFPDGAPEEISTRQSAAGR